MCEEMERDRIDLAGMRFYGYHGCLPEERREGQDFYVDATLFLSLAAAGRTDALGQTVNYAEVYALARAVVEGEPVKLIETVAERIADGILTRYARVDAVHVTVHKPSAPLGGPFRDASVSIVRKRPQEGMR